MTDESPHDITACRISFGRCTGQHQLARKHFGGEASTAIPPSVQNNCLICHTIGAKNEPAQAIAPPLFAVKNHLKGFADRDAFIAHVREWVKAPSAEHARMPGAVKKFGLMPAFPLTDEVLEEIAGWIYDTPMNKPNWTAKHYRKEHGKKATD